MSIRSVASVLSSIKHWYSEINPATLTGAIDVIVVEQEDGSFVSSPFHVRFGKLGVLKAKEKIVDIEVNGTPVDIHMKLDDNGAAFFVEGLDDCDEVPPEWATSPLPSSEPDDKSYDEAQLEACNRSLLQEFNEDDELPDEMEDSIDDASSMIHEQSEPVSKSKVVGKSKRKKKTRSKHSRTGSKSSLKELKDAINLNSHPLPQEKEEPVVAVEEEKTEDRPKAVNQDALEQSLLLSRLPLSTKDLGSFVVEDDDPRAASALDTKRQVQYFSEPEISPGTSPAGSRPGSPVMSDSEYEKRGQRSSISSGSSKKEPLAEQSWEWGQLPSSATPKHQAKDQKELKELKTDDRKTSGWGISAYLFGGQKSDISRKNNEEAPGVYLDDLKGDEEMLKIYLGSRSRSNTISRDNEDAESGTGPSLPMSPHSVEGAIGYTNSTSSHEDECKILPSVDISFCGGLVEGTEFSTLLFEQSRVSFDDFVMQIEERPADVLLDPSLVVRIGNYYYKWEQAAPIIMSHILYGRSLPQHLIEKLKGKDGKNSQLKDGKSTDERKRSSWWPFGSRYEKEEANNMVGTEASVDVNPEINEATTPLKTAPKPPANVPEVSIEDETSIFNKKKRLDTTSSSSDADIIVEKCRKTLRISSDAIKCLNLKKGANEVQFSVTTAYQGTTRCFCHVYLWHYQSKIVISDIDGTITKSDVLGHVLPIIGRDWAQSGVASLFTKIVNNGYNIVYLSARAIGQASITKDYLASIKQGEVNLPDGPIFLNPTSLVNAFHREVIEKKPEEFKIACLRDIKRLFPEDENPFCAGFGNRVNDVWAYQAVGIPMSRIFTINHRGELKHELTNVFQTSYGSMVSIVDHVFPPTDARSSPSTALGFSSFTYWRESLPKIADDMIPDQPEQETSDKNEELPLPDSEAGSKDA